MKFLLRSVMASLALAMSCHAQTYPAKPVRVLIANPPGSAIDILARGLGQHFTVKTGQPFIMDNRVGADGVGAMEACAKSAPDGYTLCVSHQGAIVVNPLLRSNLPYDAATAFTPVFHFGYSDSGLVVSADFPAQSFASLLELAKQKPNAVSWGIFSFTSGGNMYAEWLKRTRGVPLLVVPYKSPQQMLQAILGGEVDTGVFTPVARLPPQVRSGKLRVLAVTSEVREKAFPDVPTFIELGIDLPLRTWFAVIAPAGTPPEVIAFLNAEANAWAQAPDSRRKYIEANGINYVPNTPEQFSAFVDKSRRAFSDLLKIVPVKPQ